MNLIDQLLKYYDLDLKGLEKREEITGSFLDPFNNAWNFKNGINFINNLIASKKKFVIYGDYDVDGMTSTSILLMTLKSFNVDVGYYIPSRYKDGYGLSKNMIDQFKSKNYEVLITVDNGIGKYDEIDYAKKLGFYTIIIDHHLINNDKVPNADFIFHHLYSHYVTYNISAAFLTLLVSYGLLKRYDEYFITLAGIAALSDIMPLIEGNLLLVKKALFNINKGLYPQFNYLLFKQEVLPKHVSNKLQIVYNKNNEAFIFPVYSKDVSFNIISFLNSLGRVDIGTRVNMAVKFLTATDLNEIQKYYKDILKVNSLKKDLMVKAKNDLSINDNPFIDIQLLEHTQVGILGSIINGLVSKNNKNTILLAYKDEKKDILVGSGRGIDGYDLYEIVNKHKDEFLTFGGHPYAFGLSFYAKNFSKIKDELENDILNSDFKIPSKKYLLLDFNNITLDDYLSILRFDPFGNQFMEPNFIFKLQTKDLVFSKDGNSILLSNANGIKLNFFHFDKEILKTKEFYLSACFSYNIFRNQIQYTFIGTKVIPELNSHKIIS